MRILHPLRDFTICDNFFFDGIIIRCDYLQVVIVCKNLKRKTYTYNLYAHGVS